MITFNNVDVDEPFELKKRGVDDHRLQALVKWIFDQPQQLPSGAAIVQSIPLLAESHLCNRNRLYDVAALLPRTRWTPLGLLTKFDRIRAYNNHETY